MNTQLDIEDAIASAHEHQHGVIGTVTEITHRNEYGPVEILGEGPPRQLFKWIGQEGREPYLVFADTMRYRMDGELDPLDVRWTMTWQET